MLAENSFGAILNFIVNYKEIGWVNFIKDISYFGGGFYLFKYLKNRNFLRQKEVIATDLVMREAIGKELGDYIHQQYKLRPLEPIAIRLVSWKNYPSAQNDGYRRRIHYRTLNNYLIADIWIDRVGIWLEDTSVFLDFSLYVDKDKIFFSALPDRQYRDFRELKGVGVVYQLPFEHIINFDFKEFIEYEPVIYTKYYYSAWKKLYSREIRVKKKLKDGKYNTEEYGLMQLDARNNLKRYNYSRHKILQARIMLEKFYTSLIDLIETGKSKYICWKYSR